ncbi:MAG: four helix bundle protein [Bacteroidetes bacterium]|nr:four helix bundle protein [Bacteroidota bacterium]
MNSEELKARTKRFALEIIALADILPKTKAADVIFGQLLRAGTSVGANYRSACKGRSRADFISKITIVEEEADECQYWMELLSESGIMKGDVITPLHQEAKELTAIFTASGKTAKSRR